METKVRDLYLALGAETGNDYYLSAARFFAIKTDGTYRLIHSAEDVYDGLESLSSVATLTINDEAIAVETCGWAAPVDNDNGSDEYDGIAPSQHPLRRRVRLLALVTRQYTAASALGFADDDEVITDSGQAKGSLADALLLAMKTLVSKTN